MMKANSSSPEPSNNGNSNRPIRDEAAALAAVGGDQELANELLETLLAGLPAELDDMKHLQAACDWPKLADLAHQIRGATRYCGVPALDETMGALQKAAESADPPRIDALIAQSIQRAQQLQDMVL